MALNHFSEIELKVRLPNLKYHGLILWFRTFVSMQFS